MMKQKLCLLLISLSLIAVAAPFGAAPQGVSVVADATLSPPAQHGLNQLMDALQSRGISMERQADARKASRSVVVLLTKPGSENLRHLKSALHDVTLPSDPEALMVKKLSWGQKSVLLLGGADDRGLMYAASDVAQQIRLSDEAGNPLESVAEVSERPAVKERGLSKVVMNQSEFESYFYSEEYWSKYLDMLARDRFNNFVLMFGYSSAGYMDPPYPFLFDTEGFPGVRVVGIAKEKQGQNLQALQRIVRMTHQRGMEFTLALWTHIHRIKQETPGLVYGLTDDNLIPYSQAALKKLLALVPGIDRIQFRVHVESSLELPQQIPFWKAIFDAIETTGQKIKIDMRVKGFNDDMIDAALASKLPVRLATKYWGEQMGLPYHPTHIEWRNQYDRRHSYANLLRYPKRYDMLWRLWNLGTTRILLWGDPEYVKRFAESTRLYGEPAFEVSEPLAFKMGHHREPTFPLLTKDYQYYRWEFERYWPFYQVFGRVGYNPDAPPRVWQMEFEKRFGHQAAPFVERALAVASRILPRIVAYNLVDLSADRAWAEKQRWGDLPEYVNAPPSDTEQFVGIREAARLYLDDKPSTRIWPEQTAEWFTKTAGLVLDEVKRAEQASSGNSNKEFVSTMIDLKVLANLALYHSQRIHSGLSYALFIETQNLSALDNAIRYEKAAIRFWEEIVKLTDGVYHDNLIFGGAPLLTGHWKDELALLRKGLAELERRRASFSPQFRKVVRKFSFGDGPAEEGFLKVTSNVRSQRYSPLEGGYGWLAAYLLPGPKAVRGPHFVYGPPPDAYTESAFVVDLPNGYYELQFIMQDTSETPRDHGPMWIEAEGRHSTDHFPVPAGQRVEKRLETQVTNGRLGISFHSATGATWLVNNLVITRVEPVIAHVPVRRAKPNQELQIQATLGGPSPIREARLIYGTAEKGYRSVSMKRTDTFLYSGAIPVSTVMDGLNYTLEAEDEVGRHVRHGPVHVIITDDYEPPVVTHAKIQEAFVGQPLTVEARVADPSGVKAVHLRYRSVNQQQEFATVPMLSTGSDNRYVARIPAWAMDPRWDLMYFIEAYDTKGNGKIYPDLEKETPYVVVKLRRQPASNANFRQ